MATTNDPRLASLMRAYRSHGITKDPNEFINENFYEWSYEQQLLGFNYRMSDIQAALGISQLKCLDEWLEKRLAIARKYMEELSDFDLGLPQVPSHAQSAWHLFVLRLDTQKRLPAYQALKNVGIAAQVHYLPVHLHPFYQTLGFSKGDFPNSEVHADSALSLPIYPDLTEEQQNLVISTLKEVLLT